MLRCASRYYLYLVPTSATKRRMETKKEKKVKNLEIMESYRDEEWNATDDTKFGILLYSRFNLLLHVSLSRYSVYFRTREHKLNF